MKNLQGVASAGVLLLASIFAAGQIGPARTHRPQIIAYVFPKDRVLGPGDVAVDKLTRINYAFANIKNGQIVEGESVDATNFAVLSAMKVKQPSLELFVSVGGWLWSGQFSDAVLTPASRARFIDSVVRFLERYKLDGLDIDWEYPGLIGAGNKFRPEDKENFTLLLRELRTRLDAEQARLHRPLLLSIAAAGSDEYLAHTQMGELQHFLDTVNLMAYDYYEPDDGHLTGNHAPLYTDPADPKKVSAASSVKAMEAAGVPAQKIVLGVPFYGHVWAQVPPTDHGLFQSGGPAKEAYTTYDGILNGMIGHGFTRYWDEASKVPYLYSPQKSEFVSYEDPQSLTYKCGYVQKNGLAGVMFWEYFGDQNGALLNALHQCLDKKPVGRTQ